jgi:transcriptional regulator GlxA family with amidase domain
MKQLGILIFDDVEVLDFAGPFEVFSVANQLADYKILAVHTLAYGPGPIRAKNGLQVLPDKSLGQLDRLDYLVLPGGDGSKNVIQNPSLMASLQHLVSQTAWTMSVCSGSRILGKSGFLDHKPYCTHHEVFDSMASLVPTGIPKPEHRFIQCDSRIWTAAGISAGIDLALHLVELTFGKELALDTATYMEYTPYTNTHAR